jgi:hypothetical protein
MKITERLADEVRRIHELSGYMPVAVHLGTKAAEQFCEEAGDVLDYDDDAGVPGLKPGAMAMWHELNVFHWPDADPNLARVTFEFECPK